MDTIPSLGARPSIKDPRTAQHSNLKTLAGVPNIKGGHSYLPSDIEHQRNVGICTAISIVQAAEKFYGKKFSPEFQYLMQKKFMDKNWGEGSSILSALKTAKKFGFLPLEDFPYVTEQDRDVSYSVYIKKLWDIPQVELDRLCTISKNYSLAGYASVGIDPTALANAITTSQAGILTRYEVGSEWWVATDGRISWSSTDINPLRPPTPQTFASGHAVIMSSYDFTTNNWTILANTWSKDWNKQGLADVLLGYYNPTEAWIPYFELEPEQDEELKKELTKKISLLEQIVFLLRKAIELQNKLKGVKHL